MVAVFVREHVCLGERAALGAEARLQLVVEAEVDVDALVGRAVERADLRVREPAAGLDGIGKEDRVRGRVAVERLLPVGLDRVDVGDQPAVLALVRVLARAAFLLELGRALAGADLLALEQLERRGRTAAAEHVQEDDREHDHEPEPAAADGHRRCTATADVGDLAGIELGSAAKSHGGTLPRVGN